MAWYDTFSTFYDRSLERLYAPYRAEAFAAVQLAANDVVLDVACGTAQNLTALKIPACDHVHYVGVDMSAGMLRAARARTQGFPRATFMECPIGEVTSEQLEAATEKPLADLVVCTLGLTVVPAWEDVFASAWALLRPGGTMVVMDVCAKKRDFQTWMVEKMAQADLAREVWRPLERDGEAFQMTWTDAPTKKMGGNLFFACAQKAI